MTACRVPDCKMLDVKLEAFKPGGKWYASGTLQFHSHVPWHGKLEAVIAYLREGKFPGLMDSAGPKDHYIVRFVDVFEDGTEGVPHLINTGIGERRL